MIVAVRGPSTSGSHPAGRRTRGLEYRSVGPRRFTAGWRRERYSGRGSRRGVGDGIVVHSCAALRGIIIGSRSARWRWSRARRRARRERVAADLVNVAVRGKARQSSTVPAGEAWRAIDGSVNGNYQRGSVTHTVQGTTEVWFELDLLRPWRSTRSGSTTAPTAATNGSPGSASSSRRSAATRAPGS